mmetsp:Transcript_18932/g.72238  ORF Transcript_18932/g.72238 Transcript_18932/m.72238 type:complete len:393 (-) Transcript_18932:1376-2554(-)
MSCRGCQTRRQRLDGSGRRPCGSGSCCSGRSSRPAALVGSSGAAEPQSACGKRRDRPWRPVAAAATTTTTTTTQWAAATRTAPRARPLASSRCPAWWRCGQGRASRTRPLPTRRGTRGRTRAAQCTAWGAIHTGRTRPPPRQACPPWDPARPNAPAARPAPRACKRRCPVRAVAWMAAAGAWLGQARHVQQPGTAHRAAARRARGCSAAGGLALRARLRHPPPPRSRPRRPRQRLSRTTTTTTTRTTRTRTVKTAAEAAAAAPTRSRPRAGHLQPGQAWQQAATRLRGREMGSWSRASAPLAAPRAPHGRPRPVPGATSTTAIATATLPQGAGGPPQGEHRRHLAGRASVARPGRPRCSAGFAGPSPAAAAPSTTARQSPWWGLTWPSARAW